MSIYYISKEDFANSLNEGYINDLIRRLLSALKNGNNQTLENIMLNNHDPYMKVSYIAHIDGVDLKKIVPSFLFPIGKISFAHHPSAWLKQKAETIIYILLQKQIKYNEIIDIIGQYVISNYLDRNIDIIKLLDSAIADLALR